MQAVVFAAFFNVVVILIYQLRVATTVGKGIADKGVVNVYVVFGALCGAITWNVITWLYGIPSSSSNALISDDIMRTVAIIFVSPLLGYVFSSMMMVLVA